MKYTVREDDTTVAYRETEAEYAYKRELVRADRREALGLLLDSQVFLGETGTLNDLYLLLKMAEVVDHWLKTGEVEGAPDA